MIQKSREFDPWDKTILQFAALCHDLGHNGIPNIKWSNALIRRTLSSSGSITSNDSQHDSYNERMHIELMQPIFNIHKHALFPQSMHEYALETIVSLILSTDLKYHAEYMDIILSSSKMGKMIRVVKLADISHPLRPFRVHAYWVFKIHSLDP